METRLKYILPSRGTVLLDNLTGSQLVKKFTAFYGTRKFMTAFINARHLSLFYTQKYISIKTLWDPWTNSCFWYKVLFAEVKNLTTFTIEIVYHDARFHERQNPSYSFVDNIYYSNIYRILSFWGRTLHHRVIGWRRFEAQFCLKVKGRNVEEGKHVASKSRNSFARPCRVILRKKEKNLSYAAAKFQRMHIQLCVA
jgi:hypothetical protein